MKKFLYRVAALLWLLNNSNKELYFDNDSDDLFCLENNITSVTFIEMLDEVVDRFLTNWWSVISKEYDQLLTPWHRNEWVKQCGVIDQYRSAHHENWSNINKFLVEGKVHHLIYKGIDYPFTVKVIGDALNSGVQEIDLSVVIDEVICTIHGTARYSIPEIVKEFIDMVKTAQE